MRQAAGIISGVDGAACGDAVGAEVVPQGDERVVVPLARVQLRAAGVDEVRQCKVTDARIQVDDGLAGREPP